MKDRKQCWTWTGSHWGTDGRPTRNKIFVYRIMYEQLRGPIPQGMVAHHVCNNRKCINPWHIELMTRAEHSRLHYPEQVQGLNRKRREKTHCKHGHEFTKENTYRTSNGGRACRACRLQWGREGRIRRGINPGKYGERNNQAKLTDSIVRQIRSVKQWTKGKSVELAIKYGVSQATINYVRTNKLWKHVT